MTAEEVVLCFAPALFIRSEAEVKRPVVLLGGERTNIYGVLEKHFRETALPPGERFWKAVRGQWSPPLETWRPRVNGTQLKVLAGARLPESEEEWAALRAALAGVRQHLRSDTSVEALHRELRDFVAMVVAWWEQRKKPDGQGGAGLLKRVASAGVLLGGGGMVPLGPLGKKPCLEYLHLGGHSGLQPPQHPQVVPQATHYGGTIYAAPEIIAHPLLGGGGGSGRLPDRAAGEALGAPGAQGVVIEELNPSAHGGGGYLQALVTTTSEAQLFGQLFPPGGGEAPGSGGGGGAVHSPQAQREGSAENKEPTRPAVNGGGGGSASSGKQFVTLNVGGHRFLTTSATLAAAEGSYFAKLAQQAAARAGAGSAAEFFVDRSGKLFEYVLDYLRSLRFHDAASALPKDERTLALLAREADFFQLPELAERARAALADAEAAAAAAVAATAAAALPAACPGEDTPSDVPATFALEGSAHGGQLAASRLGGGASRQASGAPAGPATLDALFLETGFQPAAGLAEAQASVLQRLNATLQAKQAEGFAVADCTTGTEREGPLRNLFYHVLLRKQA